MTHDEHPPLRCCGCGREYTDHRLNCERCPDALLRTVYRNTRFSPSDDSGIFKFKCWLPGRQTIPTRNGPAVIRSDGYARRLGLRRLFVAYNGYWPERGAHNVTASFKDLEATPTIPYLRERGVGGIVLASAGNTARAFAHAASLAGFPCLVVVPERVVDRLWMPGIPSDCVRCVAVGANATYADAIRVAQEISRRFGVTNEGGARNVVRRDGMGTTILEYARLTGEVPHHYVQAVGSGTGGIAAYEAGLRLRTDGRFGARLPKLHLVQNTPVTPIHDRWSATRAVAAPATPAEDGASDGSAYAEVLANHQPPYDVAGGVRTALHDTDGLTYAVSRSDAQRAKAAFETAEGITIHEAAACACGGLEQAVRYGLVNPEEPILLNITGGGDDLVRRDYGVHPLRPACVIRPDEVSRLPLALLPGYVSA